MRAEKKSKREFTAKERKKQQEGEGEEDREGGRDGGREGKGGEEEKERKRKRENVGEKERERKRVASRDCLLPSTDWSPAAARSCATSRRSLIT